MPDNRLLQEEFRPGAIRLARRAEAESGEEVVLLPVGVSYKRDQKDAHWTHSFLRGARSMFLGMRNPMHWDPLFKLNLDELDEAERIRVTLQRARAMSAYKNSHITSYGAVVVVGEPIKSSELPADPVAAIEQIRRTIADLLKEAEQH